VLWDLFSLTQQVGAHLAAAEAQLRLEQAVYGLDSQDEKSLQAMLAAALGAHYSVAREVHYPSTLGRKLTHRPRCDLVLAPLGKPLRLDWAPATLFDNPHQSEPAEALWLEVKIAYQYRAGGVRHGGYGAQWRQAVVDDLRKMEADPLIREAALLLIVFNESADVLSKDLELFETMLMRKEVLAGSRHVQTVPILERINHRLCTAALWPTIQR
jgi:hypothetical protein